MPANDHGPDPLANLRVLAHQAVSLSDGLSRYYDTMSGLAGIAEPSKGPTMPSASIVDSIEFLKYFLDAGPVFAVELLPNVPDPIMIRTTKTLEGMFGYAPGELNGKPISILIPPDKKAIHGSHILRFLDHPTDRQMGNLGDVRPEGCTLKGERFPIVLTWTRFFVETRHFAAGTVMAQIENQEITQLKAEVARLKSLLESQTERA